MVLKEVLSRYYGPDAQELAISFLADGEPDVVRNVVQLVARKGDARCVDPLLDTLASLAERENRPLPPRAEDSWQHVRHEIVARLLGNDKWNASRGQVERLRQHLRTDWERACLDRRFGEKSQDR